MDAFLALLLFVAPSFPQASSTEDTPRDTSAVAKPETPPQPMEPNQATTPKPATPWQILTSGAADDNAARRAETIAALDTMHPTQRVLHLMENGLEDKAGEKSSSPGLIKDEV